MKGIDIDPIHTCTLCGERDADVVRFRDKGGSIWHYHRACAAMWSQPSVRPFQQLTEYPEADRVVARRMEEKK